MNYTALLLAIASMFAHVHATIYPDVVSLFSNVPQVSTLWAFLQQYPDVINQYTHLTNVTIFAASNDALISFESTTSEFNQPSDRMTLESILNYHIVIGQQANLTKSAFVQSFLVPSTFTNVTGGQYVGLSPTANNSVQILSGLGQTSLGVAGPFHWSSGVVYVIDKILQIPSDVTTTTKELNLTASSGALNKTQLVTSLANTWDVTLFAPANAAFQAVGSAISDMSISDLTNLMEYHLLTGNVVYSNKFGNKKFETAQGTNITMSTHADGSVYVNNAKIIQKDILLTDGVLHIIDNVMNPTNTTVAPASATSGIVAFAGASAIGQVPFTNLPLAPGTTSTPNRWNTTTPAPATSSSAHRRRPDEPLPPGETAAVVLGVLLAIALTFGGIVYRYRARGYRMSVSRKSWIISPPYLKQERYELPEQGGHTDKVELSADKRRTMLRPSSPAYPTEKRERPMRKVPSPVSPMTPHNGMWELSAEHDVRQRIEALLRPRDKP